MLRRFEGEVPVERHARATARALDMTVEQPDTIRVLKTIAKRLAFFDLESFDDLETKLRAERRRFFAVKLQRINSILTDCSANELVGGIDEHTNLRNERR